jgi:hypothetical protein
MKLSQFASNLVSRNHFIKASFGGFQGSGKTRTATEFPNNNAALIRNEINIKTYYFISAFSRYTAFAE